MMVLLDGLRGIQGLVPVDVWTVTVEFESEADATDFAHDKAAGQGGSVSIGKMIRWMPPSSVPKKR